MSNAPDVLQSAMARAAWNAVGTFAVTFLTVFQATRDWQSALIFAGISALGVLGFRGVVEGGFDASRAVSGSVQKGDVAANLAPLAPTPPGGSPPPPGFARTAAEFPRSPAQT